MNLIHDIEPVAGRGVFRMIVENPRGVAGKYEVNKRYGIIGLDRISHSAMPFPFEYGFIPGTWNDSDDDPSDIMAIVDMPTFVGCLLHVRIIGMYRVIDSDKEDNKLLSVCSTDRMFKDVKTIADLPTLYLKRIEFFWNNYKKITPRKDALGLGWSGKAAALKYVDESIEIYKNKLENGYFKK